MYGYTAGTVFAVKSVIRERDSNRRPMRPMSIGLVELCFTLVLLALLIWPGA